jgi:hypothetical protein
MAITTFIESNKLYSLIHIYVDKWITFSLRNESYKELAQNKAMQFQSQGNMHYIVYAKLQAGNRAEAQRVRIAQQVGIHRGLTGRWESTYPTSFSSNGEMRCVTTGQAR